MAEKTALTPKQRKGCLIGCLTPIIIIGIILIIAAMVDAGTKNEKKDAVKKVSDTSLSANERISAAVVATIGEKLNDLPTVASVEFKNNNAQITINSDANGGSKTTLINNSKEILKNLSKISEVKSVSLTWLANTTDQYGNKSMGTIMMVVIPDESFSKMNWDNYQNINLENAAMVAPHADLK
ncbi:hypothetical protein FQ087_05940 [Sporosarcina sp. ANT_H38]|uniref:hypothetical protein n=1 Tax=Sporosarcina sp. ANT_H38 TaxID=2597358 RepID=UPI0011F11289|nr:hypothetical protein [Sporosarcina sp. ANT_H38]KAA0965809.1 hypothetical protein FQ087_05940 [Sporosarcina sp. ANT_H38]